ncbi:hypothetical protein [Actinokineospora xionganensis]|uniref:Uncharacterized protein n=1 Tax=Actinokineospora xionganensis TaxID=2684470 RepID=A0ABR7L3K0_9PSEU|nr:hypothetical protein [Actinokineospora xionganensis]MBC6447270.1 hypothetical protein [Actinokineospora xionganensis]
MEITWRWLPSAAVMLVGAAILVAPMVVVAAGGAYVRVAAASMSPTGRHGFRGGRLARELTRLAGPGRGAIPLTAIKSVVVATREGPLPAVTAFADAGLAGTPTVATQATGLPLSLIGGGVVFMLGTVWLGLRLSRKRPTD